MMESREKYISGIMAKPAKLGFTEIKFVHTPQLFVGQAARLRCHYACHHANESAFTPPQSPTIAETAKIFDEYKYGLLLRREEPFPFQPNHVQVWSRFEQSVLEIEHEAFVRGYGKAFALAVGTCLFGHHDDSSRPCQFPGKRRPTLESVGIDIHETFEVIAWKDFLTRDPENPFQLFGLLLLE